MSDDDDVTRQVRRLLLSGDNTLKNRSGPERLARARARFEEARELARRAELDPTVVRVIDLRLDQLRSLEEAGGPA